MCRTDPDGPPRITNHTQMVSFVVINERRRAITYSQYFTFQYNSSDVSLLGRFLFGSISVKAFSVQNVNVVSEGQQSCRSANSRSMGPEDGCGSCVCVCVRVQM